MAQTNLELAQQLQDLWPNSFLPLQRFVAAMADCMSAPGDGTYQALDNALAEVVRGIVADKPALDGPLPAAIREELLFVLAHFRRAFPNWQDAYQFAHRFLVEDPAFAESKIDGFLRAGGGAGQGGQICG